MTTHAQDSKKAHALRLIKRQGIARARDLEAAGVAIAYLRRLVEEGVVEVVELDQPVQQDRLVRPDKEDLLDFP